MREIKNYIAHLWFIITGRYGEAVKCFHLPKSLKVKEYVDFAGRQEFIKYKFQHIYKNNKHVVRYYDGKRWFFRAEENTHWYACSELSKQLAKHRYLWLP